MSGRVRKTVTAGAFVVVLVALTNLYRSWLRDRTLFYDEWMYLEELADAGGWSNWVLAPMQEHLTPVAKSIFVLNNVLFGYSGQAFTAVSLVLHLSFIASICWFLRAASIGRDLVLVVALLLATTAAYPEVVIWSHDKLVLFFVGLFGALALFLRAERDAMTGEGHGSLPLLSGLCCCMLLSMMSLGLGLFTATFFAVFAFVYRPRALLRGSYLAALLVAGFAFIALYVAFAHHGVSSDFEARVGERWSLAALAGAIRTSLFSIVFGSLLPLVHVHRRPPQAWFSSGAAALLLGGSLVTAAALSLSLTRIADHADGAQRPLGKTRTSIFVLGLTVVSVTSISQNFYRARGTYAGLGFVLDWNRYAFLPCVGLILCLTAVCKRRCAVHSEPFQKSIAVAAVMAIVATFPSAVSEANVYQAYFFRNSRVKEIQAAFEPLFGPHVWGGITDAVLPDIVIDEPLFVRPLRLSTYARFHRPGLGTAIRFLSPAEFDRLAPEERRGIRDFIRGTPVLVALYGNASVVPRAIAEGAR